MFIQSNLFENINFKGLAFHIGSQITKLEPFEEACKITNQLIKEVESNGFTIKTIDVGGGIGIDENEKFQFKKYFGLINSYFAKKDRTIIFEPGRTIIGNTSILVSKILYIKETEGKIFVVIDAGMNDFMRPALYGATHEILPILQSDVKKNKVIEFVGPICETSDKFLTLDTFQNINEGDLFIAGATGPLHVAAALNKKTVGFYPSMKSSTSLRWDTINDQMNKLVFDDNDSYSQDIQVDIQNVAAKIYSKLLK